MFQVFNFSTGRIINKLVIDDEVTSMDHDHTGQLLFCGDAQVCLLWFLLCSIWQGKIDYYIITMLIKIVSFWICMGLTYICLLVASRFWWISLIWMLVSISRMHLHVPFLFFSLGLHEQGCIYSVSMDSHNGTLSRSHRHRSSSKRKSAVTTMQYRSFSLLAGGPVLLACTQDGNISFFRFGQ